MLPEPEDILVDAWSPDLLRREGHALVDRLADQLASSLAAEGPVVDLRPPEERIAHWSDPRHAPRSDLDAVVADALTAITRLHHPRCVGHQVPPPLPVASLADLVAAHANNGMAVYEMGQVGVAMERAVLHWIADRIGWSDAEGALTSGGSLGNLTALLAARQTGAGYDAWASDATGGPPLAVLAARDAHYSVDRCVRILGWGAGGIVPVDVDGSGRMRPDALAGALASAHDAGRRVIAVVASAGSTAVGAFDPLAEIASFCAEHDLWFHVDAAHGGPFILSERLAPRLRGLERADSLVWDAHKMMAMPALVTAVLFRNGDRSYDAFAQEASYIFAGDDPREEWYNPAGRTFECTKRLMALKVWATMAVHGEALFAAYVERGHAQAARFAELVGATAEFELAVAPEANIVCFRFVGLDDDDHARIRRAVIERGDFYLTQTRFAGRLWLRCTFMNPMTGEDELIELLETLRRVG